MFVERKIFAKDSHLGHLALNVEVDREETVPSFASKYLILDMRRLGKFLALCNRNTLLGMLSYIYGYQNSVTKYNLNTYVHFHLGKGTSVCIIIQVKAMPS